MKGWKTLLFAILVAIMGALEQFDFSQIFTGENGGLWLGVVGIIIGVLRKFTNSPMLKGTVDGGKDGGGKT